MNAFGQEPMDHDDDLNISEEEVVRNFNRWGYRGYQETRSHQEGPVVVVTVSNKKGHTTIGKGETREEAIEDIIEQIDRHLEVK